MRIKHWSWAYVLHILNNEAASITFHELFEESVRASQGDLTTQVFLSVLQNELLQDELFSFLRAFAQMCVAKIGALQLGKLKDLEILVYYGVMASSELKVEFESFTRGSYEKILQEMYTNPVSPDEPPYLTVYLTTLLDDADALERPSRCSDGQSQLLKKCKDQHTSQNTGAKEICTSHVEQITGSDSTDWQIASNTDVTATAAELSTTCLKTREYTKPLICESGRNEPEIKTVGIPSGIQSSGLKMGAENATTSCVFTGATPQSQQQPQKEHDPSGKLVVPHNKPANLLVNLCPSSLHSGEQHIRSAMAHGQSSKSPPVVSKEADD